MPEPGIGVFYDPAAGGGICCKSLFHPLEDTAARYRPDQLLKKGDRSIFFDFLSKGKFFDIPVDKRYAQYMHREKRLLLANFPHHIIQRGH
ncbi:MAG: hypothetical protein KGY42_04495, partial [Desulfobacterales bacterium]|nr:hypothetical protein [Desulfobacterales bacterium]